MKRPRSLGKRKKGTMTVHWRRKKRIKRKTEKINDSLMELYLSRVRKSGDCFHVDEREKFVFSSVCVINDLRNNERIPIS